MCSSDPRVTRIANTQKVTLGIRPFQNDGGERLQASVSPGCGSSCELSATLVDIVDQGARVSGESGCRLVTASEGEG